MKPFYYCLCLAAFSASAWLPAGAHHSFLAQFDKGCAVRLEGRVAKVAWYNPHVWIHVEGERDDKAERWAFEFGSPNALVRRGWRRDSLKVGDAVTIEGFCAKDGSLKAAASAVTLTDGTQLFAVKRDDGA